MTYIGVQIYSKTLDQKPDILLIPKDGWKDIVPLHSYMGAIRGIENGTATIYSVIGDVFPWICIMALLLILGKVGLNLIIKRNHGRHQA